MARNRRRVCSRHTSATYAPNGREIRFYIVSDNQLVNVSSSIVQAINRGGAANMAHQMMQGSGFYAAEVEGADGHIIGVYND